MKWTFRSFIHHWHHWWMKYTTLNVWRLTRKNLTFGNVSACRLLKITLLSFVNKEKSFKCCAIAETSMNDVKWLANLLFLYQQEATGNKEQLPLITPGNLHSNSWTQHQKIHFWSLLVLHFVFFTDNDEPHDCSLYLLCVLDHPTISQVFVFTSDYQSMPGWWIHKENAKNVLNGIKPVENFDKFGIPLSCNTFSINLACFKPNSLINI